MKFTIFAAAILIASACAVSAQTLLDQLVSLNTTAAADGTKYNVSTLLALATPFKPVLDILNGTDTVTVFAPTDEAIAAAIKALGATPSSDDILKILQYHVIPGISFVPPSAPTTVVAKTALSAPGLGVNATQNIVIIVNATAVQVKYAYGKTANVVSSVTGSNGIIHLVDGLLLPPADIAKTATAAGLTKLVDAVVATNITSALLSAKNITVFAPTNAAFEAIANVTSTLAVNQIAAVLQYHVVPAGIFSPVVVGLPAGNTSIPTLLGQNVTISKDGSTILLFGPGNKAGVKLVATDVLVENGVVHVIDAVLIPDLTKVPAVTASASAATASATSTSSTTTKNGATSAKSSSVIMAAVVVIFTVALAAVA